VKLFGSESGPKSDRNGSFEGTGFRALSGSNGFLILGALFGCSFFEFVFDKSEGIVL